MRLRSFHESVANIRCHWIRRHNGVQGHLLDHEYHRLSDPHLVNCRSLYSTFYVCTTRDNCRLQRSSLSLFVWVDQRKKIRDFCNHSSVSHSQNSKRKLWLTNVKFCGSSSGICKWVGKSWLMRMNLCSSHIWRTSIRIAEY